jgi:hypothetical protein
MRRLLTVRLLMRPLTIHRLHSVFAVLNGCYLASLLRSLSSLGVVFRGFHVLWRSFTLPVWSTRCFNRTMTEWLTLNRSAVWPVGHTTPCHSNRLPSLCIWQFSTCHVEIEFTQFKVLHVLHVQYRFESPAKLECCKGTGELIKTCFIVLWINRWMKDYRYHERIYVYA